MHVTVDSGRCQGHAKCMIDCPEVFESDDQGFAVVVLTDVPPDLVDRVLLAQSSCPESAILVSAQD
jgi:ferredoxin